jgi:sigma-B regulation protein RsbU (phosphoserine phosphatase)
MYTDGLVEATKRDQEMYGVERLQRAALSHRPMSAGDAIGEIRMNLDGFSEGMPLMDDTTLLAARVTE